MREVVLCTRKRARRLVLDEARDGGTRRAGSHPVQIDRALHRPVLWHHILRRGVQVRRPDRLLLRCPPGGCFRRGPLTLLRRGDGVGARRRHDHHPADPSPHATERQSTAPCLPRTQLRASPPRRRTVATTHAALCLTAAPVPCRWRLSASRTTLTFSSCDRSSRAARCPHGAMTGYRTTAHRSEEQPLARLLLGAHQEKVGEELERSDVSRVQAENRGGRRRCPH